MPLKLGDRNESVREWRRVVNARFGGLYSRLHGPLPTDTDQFGPRAQAWQREYQFRTLQAVNNTSGSGVVSDHDLGALGIPIPVEVALPIIFTVEGHLSNMFFGPCAQTAQALETQGVCRWKPVGDWDNAALPFKNATGVEALYRQLSRTWIEGPPVDPNHPDGPKIMWYFGPEVPWGGVAFSQGAMVFCEFMWKYVLPPNAPLHWRLAGFKRGLMYGNPRRAKDAVCAWAQSPPQPGTHGIMDRLFDAHAEGIGDRWAEHPNDDDMFAEVGDDDAGRNQTAVAKIITENTWTGGPSSILTRLTAIFGNPLGGIIGVAKATVDAIMFLAANPNPHYSTFATPGDIEWMRGVAA
jgi:hypothetical protein